MGTTSTDLNCYASYEVPYNGVSIFYPTGHLQLALRNRGERNVSENNLFCNVQQHLGHFYKIGNQSMLRGVLNLSHWQLCFLPCVRSTGNKTMRSAYRLLLLRTLQRTEPGFYRTWMSQPGTIHLAKIEYLLIVDRHERVYKFDPILDHWTSSLDGAKPTNTSKVLRMVGRTNGSVPHTPHRLLLFTTDFEVYAFCFSLPGEFLTGEKRPPLINQLLFDNDHTDKPLKFVVRHFVDRLARRISRVRTAAPWLLANEYACDSNTKEEQPKHIVTSPSPPRSDHATRFGRASLTPPYNDADQPAQSLNLFAVLDLEREGKEDEIQDATCRALNRYPVHPTERLHDTWFQASVEFQWTENPEFSVCLTYPLKVPTVDLQTSVQSIAGHFVGHRFPVFSCFCPAKTSKSDLGVWLIRTGHVAFNALLRTTRCEPLTDHVCDTDRHDGKIKYLIQIRIEYCKSLDALLESIDDRKTYNLKVSNNGMLLPSITAPITGDDAAKRGSPDGRPLRLIDHRLPSHTWMAPEPKQVHKTWLSFGSLVRIPQIHVPGATDRTADSESVVYDSNMSLESLHDNVPPKIDIKCCGSSSSLLGFPHGCSISKENSFNNEFNNPKRDSNLFFSTRKTANLGDGGKLSCGSMQATESTVPQVGTSARFGDLGGPLILRLNEKLNDLASSRTPHRSSWYDRLLDTGWLSLVSVCLKQAVLLVSLIHQVTFDQKTDFRNYLLAVSGPSSGRTWQAAIVSLAQLMISPHSRNLAGFEQLIEREWVRYGYPFCPDPSVWSNAHLPSDYDGGATFALFIDCVHQLLVQFPTRFSFTEDYLVLLLETALSRGGGLPPFAIEFAASCEAARCGHTAKLSDLEKEHQSLFTKGVWRSFRDWCNILTVQGRRLLPNWCYWWRFSSNPSQVQLSNVFINYSRATSQSTPSGETSSSILYPVIHPVFNIHCWLYGWFRWIRSLRLVGGGGYAFDAAFFRHQLGPKYERNQSHKDSPAFPQPKTSCSPYAGWLSDELLATCFSTISKNAKSEEFSKKLASISSQTPRIYDWSSYVSQKMHVLAAELETYLANKGD